MKRPIELEFQLAQPNRNPWPDRILLFLCFVVIGGAGSLLIAGMFGFLSS